MPDLTREQIVAIRQTAYDTFQSDPLAAATVALATEVLAQRERRCRTCRWWHDEEWCAQWQRHYHAGFGCADWTAKEGA